MPPTSANKSKYRITAHNNTYTTPAENMRPESVCNPVVTSQKASATMATLARIVGTTGPAPRHHQANMNSMTDVSATGTHWRRAVRNKRRWVGIDGGDSSVCNLEA